MRCLALTISFLPLALGLCFVCVAAAVAQTPDRETETVPTARWNAGDNPAWAQIDFEDSDWDAFVGFSETSDGVFWIRDYFTIGESFVPAANSIFSISGTGAFDIYLDGLLLGSSGAVGGSVHEERPGALQFNVGVPRALLFTGNHVLAVRASAHHLRDPSDFFIHYQLQSADRIFSRNSFNLVMLGAALAAVGIIAAFFTVSSTDARQRWIFITTLVIAASVAVITAKETAELLGFVSYTLRHAVDLITMAAALSIFVALPSLLVMRLTIKKRKAWLAGILGVAVISAPSWGSLVYEHDSRVFITLSVYCLCICAAAPANLRRQAIYFSSTIATALLGILLDPEFMYAFLVALALLLALSFALDLRARELSAKQAQLTAARLEAEMLKRNIQPHFLMNSLTVITEWIETTPLDALRFIQGLADEFRSLSNLSGKKLVPLSDEIDLCRTHLKLMGMRHKIAFALETKGLDGAETIPPGVFHTLIENAISHNRYREEIVNFDLKKIRTDKEITYILTAPLGKDTHHRDHSTGAGLKYIRSRLEESYPGQWQITSEPTDGQWVTQIHLKQ